MTQKEILDIVFKFSALLVFAFFLINLLKIDH